MSNTLPDVVLLTEKLVSIESVTGNEAAVGDYLVEYCRERGLNAEKQYCTDTRFNVLISYGDLPAEGGAYGLLLHGHMDTVPSLDMEKAFIPKTDDDYIYGRGTVDQKGGLAAAVTALVFLQSRGIQLEKPVCVAAVIDEESEHRGTMKLVESGIRADAAVITEPSNLRAVVGCKGTLPLKLTVKGKAAHGCRPWLGVNAVQKALPLLQELFDIEFPSHSYDDVPGSLMNSVNVGIVQAGTAYNNVPDSCEISLDCRISPGETVEGMRERIDQVISSVMKKDPTLQIQVSIDRPDWNWEPIRERGLKPARISASDPFIRLVENIHNEIVGNDVEFYITDGYAEIDFILNDLHIPCVLYGPGEPHLCHTSDECISLNQLRKSVEVYERLIERQCGVVKE
ncbi:MAG: M20 family metallopeptidase [Bacteroidetes bacterium]|nr:M20 family metallopeptidase [Bacteroidota bacterium]